VLEEASEIAELFVTTADKTALLDALFLSQGEWVNERHYHAFLGLGVVELAACNYKESQRTCGSTCWKTSAEPSHRAPTLVDQTSFVDKRKGPSTEPCEYPGKADAASKLVDLLTMWGGRRRCDWCAEAEQGS